MIYAIGDIHGRADLLRRLLGKIISEAVEGADGSSPRAIIIGLGDYIDRGPDSREVVEILIGLSALKRVESHFLRGNHDQTLLDFLDDPASGPAWCAFGGREALDSYGIRAPAGRGTPEAWALVRHTLLETMPQRHLDFFRSLKTSLEIGDYFFAHAGARPGVPLQSQADQDLMWIRGPFLSDSRAFEKVVVHGHSAGELIHVDQRRINVDTGAYATGQLTAVRLQGTEQSFLFTLKAGADIVVETAKAPA